MKIAHCCLSFEYVDDMAYQENILPYMDSGVKRSKTFDINLYLENLTRYLSFTSVLI